MLRSLMKAMIIFVFAIGFAVPASALWPVHAISGCAEIAADAADAPQPPCCDRACTISRGACAACVPVVGAFSLNADALPALPLGFSVAVQIDLTGIASPPEPPPPRTNLLQPFTFIGEFYDLS